MLRQIEALLEPKHLFILPEWADPYVLDRLLKEGHVSCLYEQRDDTGTIILVMGLRITETGRQLIHSLFSWPKLAATSALIGACWLAMSMMMLYWQ